MLYNFASWLQRFSNKGLKDLVTQMTQNARNFLFQSVVDLIVGGIQSVFRHAVNWEPNGEDKSKEPVDCPESLWCLPALEPFAEPYKAQLPFLSSVLDGRGSLWTAPENSVQEHP